MNDGRHLNVMVVRVYEESVDSHMGLVVLKECFWKRTDGRKDASSSGFHLVSIKRWRHKAEYLLIS